ncbi:MAG: plasmid maintenance system killer [Chitinophagaceae bacterium]|nr:plasmid maintenance system killer [Chitinophagaceae bacterium]
MIQSIRHKGLLQFYAEGKTAKLPKEQFSKIARILSALDAISSEKDIMALGLNAHPLKGTYKGFWSLQVTGNYRLIFRWIPPDVFDVDYLDYH